VYFVLQSELEDAQEKHRSIKVTLDNAYRSLLSFFQGNILCHLYRLYVLSASKLWLQLDPKLVCIPNRARITEDI